MPKKFASIEEKREYQRQVQAKWRAANPEKVEAAKPAAAERSAEWRGARTPEQREAGRAQVARWRADLKAKDPEAFNKHESERNKLYRRAIKLEIVAAYGGICTCPGCKVSEPEFLTIHHVNGDGAAHRREIFPSGTAKGGFRFYLWLKRHGYPQDGRFELHCHNCNCAKGFHGYCPHERDNILSQVEHNPI